FSPCSDPLPTLHSFPTRRSSDLDGVVHELHSLGATRNDYVLQFLGCAFANDRSDRCVRDEYLVNRDTSRTIRPFQEQLRQHPAQDRKSTRLNSSHVAISYAVFCL